MSNTLQVSDSLESLFLATLARAAASKNTKVSEGHHGISYTAGDTTLTDVRAIAAALVKGTPFAPTSAEQAEADKYIQDFLAHTVKSDQDVDNVAASVVFVVGNRLTVADVAFFLSIRGRVIGFSPEQRKKFPSVVRYAQHIQHLLGASLAPLKAISLPQAPQAPQAAPAPAPAASAAKPVGAAPAAAGKGAAKGKAAAPAAPALAAPDAADVPDIARLHLKVGRVLEAKAHPDATSLFVEQIDLGEGKPRTVVSGLVNKVPLEKLQGALVVCVVNLKPSPLRGVTSEAMVLAATDAVGKTELVTPPADAAPGTDVTPAGVTPRPDAQIDLKKSKVWENVKPKLRVGADGVAAYDGAPLSTPQGPCRVETVRDAQIA